MKTIICLRKLPNTIAVTVLLGGVGADDVDDDNNAGIDDDNVVMMVPGSTEVMEWSLQSMSPLCCVDFIFLFFETGER